MTARMAFCLHFDVGPWRRAPEFHQPPRETVAVLNIRNLPDEIHERLKERATRHGRSMEAEARTILADVILAEKRNAESVARLRKAVDAIFGGREHKGLVDEFIRERRAEGRREAARDARWAASRKGKKK